MKVAVIGAGPAGITAAYELAKRNVQVDVYEAGPHVGGLARTIPLWNQKVDLGPHRFFSQDRRVNQLWLEVVGKDYEMVERLTRIYYKKRFFFYPLKAFNALRNLGAVEALRCVSSYFLEKFRSGRNADENFESWVVHRFGRRLFEIFFKSYTEKLWGISCENLDTDFAAQRIKKLSLFEAVKNAITHGSKNKHKTLVDRFAYPHGGTGMVYERMAQFVQSKGSKVFLDMPIKKVVAQETTVTGIEFENGERKVYDHVISTMPLTHLVRGFENLPVDVRAAVERLQFRNTILVYLHIEAKDLFPDNWLYIHSPELKTGRITNFRNWVRHLYTSEESTILALEYWCYDQDAIWTKTDRELIELAKNEIRKTGLIGSASISDGYVFRIPKCYPVYSKGYKEPLEVVKIFLSKMQALTVIGRYGSFKYNNQDHSILMGLLAAENVADRMSHDLWAVNSDYDYQEKSEITETGLQSNI